MPRSPQNAREVNRQTCELSPAGSVEPGAFVCECVDLACYTTVWLTADEYDSLVASGQLVLAAGHDPPRLDEALRERLRMSATPKERVTRSSSTSRERGTRE